MHHRIITCLSLLTLIAGCGETGNSESTTSNRRLRLAVTTSTRDTGLADILIPQFEVQHSAVVTLIAVGTGQALKLGEAGEVDVVWVHAPDAEQEFMSAGHGIRHEQIMFNHFEILGPPDDPAGVRGALASAALAKIAAIGHSFVSRGDDSGTHKRERALWNRAGGLSEWGAYVESGRGMGATLVMADQMQAYTLTDRGTRLAFRDKITLEPLIDSGDDLLNQYGAMAVNPDKNDQINPKLANVFLDFLISPKVQEIIGQFTIEGELLFYPLR